MKAFKKLFTKTYRDLFFPLIIEQIFLTLIANFNVFLFSLFNDQMVAAIGISDQVLNIGAMVTNVVILGSTILILQHADRSNTSYSKRVIKESLLLNISIGIILVLIFGIFARDILSLMQTPLELRTSAATYVRIVSVSIAFLSLSSLSLSILRAFGFVSVAVRVSVINTILIIIGNSIIVLFKVGGIEQIALATLLARFIGMCLSINTVRSHIPELSDFFREKFDKDIRKNILGLGIPSAMEGISYNFSQTIITAIIASLGTLAVTSKIYTQTITSFIFSIGVAGGVSGQIIIGHLIRDRKFEKISSFARTNANMISLIGALINLALALGGGFIVRIFTDDPEIINIVTKLLFLQILLDPSRVANEILVNELNVLKDVKYSVSIGMLVNYAFVLPASFIVVNILGLGIKSIWLIFIIDEMLRRVLFDRRIKSKKFMEINENEWFKETKA